MNTVTEIRFIAGLGFVLILYSLWMGRMTAQNLPDNYRNPVLALELVKNESDIKQIVQAEGGKALGFVRRNTYKDFGYIILYAVFFIWLSLLLSRIGFSWAGSVGLAAAACAGVAAVLDVVEDLGMLKAINGQASDALANSIRYPSLAKWSFLFIFSLLVGLLLIARRDLFVIPAVCFLLAAILGLIGVISNLLQPRFYPAFPAALALMGFGTIILAVAFAFCPEKLLNRFPSLLT